MKTQIFRIAALLLISSLHLARCEKESPVRPPYLPPEDFSDDLDPAWSPDGSIIAFTHQPVAEDTSGGPFGIYFIHPDGSGRRLFLLGAHSPAWSPDGQKLAFVLGGVISIINRDGTGLQSLGVEGFFPAWSPDGTKIAYSTGEGGSTFIIDLLKGGPPERFLDNAFFPDWSPDGRQLVFARFETPFSSSSIYKANLDGSGLTQLAKPIEKGDVHRFPAYSHAGNKIAFSSLKKGIVVMDADGKNERTVHKKPASHPSWSPDDQYLVFSGATDIPGRARLFIIKADGTGLRQLTF